MPVLGFRLFQNFHFNFGWIVVLVTKILKEIIYFEKKVSSVPCFFKGIAFAEDICKILWYSKSVLQGTFSGLSFGTGGGSP